MADVPSVFVVDDDEEVRKMLAALIGSTGLRVEAHAYPRAFLDGLDGEPTGCIVSEVLMPEMSGLELQRWLADHNSLLTFVFLSRHWDVTSAVEAMKAGAVDFIQKPFEVPHLLSAIRAAVCWNAALNDHRAKRVAAITRLAPLTAREREVLALLVSGQPNKVIASRLGISDNTVETHRASIMRKADVGHLVELVDLVRVAESELETVRRRW